MPSPLRRVPPSFRALALVLSSFACAHSPDAAAPATPPPPGSAAPAPSDPSDTAPGAASEATSPAAGTTPAADPPAAGRKPGPPGAACGGLAGLFCADGLFCDFPPEAHCGAADQTGTCQPKPGACTRIFKPVCGCDDRTYPTDCVAHAAGISVAKEGECPKP
jgi:hypothetical protein